MPTCSLFLILIQHSIKELNILRFQCRIEHFHNKKLFLIITSRNNLIPFFFGKILSTASTNIIPSLDSHILRIQMGFYLEVWMRTRLITPFFTEFFCF